MTLNSVSVVAHSLRLCSITSHVSKQATLPPASVTSAATVAAGQRQRRGQRRTPAHSPDDIPLLAGLRADRAINPS